MSAKGHKRKEKFVPLPLKLGSVNHEQKPLVDMWVVKSLNTLSVLDLPNRQSKTG
jgi:hypothetical protein